MHTFKGGLHRDYWSILKFSVNSFRLNRITITHYLEQIITLTILDYLRCYNDSLPDLAPIIIELGKNHSIFIRTLALVIYFAEPVKTSLWSVWTEQHAQLLCDQPWKKRHTVILQYWIIEKRALSSFAIRLC